MAGGLIQLVATGYQDEYLINKPDITYFKTKFKRHTNFSIEPIYQNFNSNTGFSKKVECHIGKNADLLNSITLLIKLPKLINKDTNSNDRISYINSIGYAIIDEIYVEIGGKIIDCHTGEWLNIWSELTLPNGKVRGHNEMIGKHNFLDFNNSEQIELMIPLIFWFNKFNDLSLPLISLQYHDVVIGVKFRDFNQCWISENNATPLPVSDFESSLLCDYIFLDMKEREKFAKSTHAYLIDQIQYSLNNQYQKNNSIINLDLNFNHPIKEIFWVLQSEKAIINKDIFNYNIDPDNNDSINDAFKQSTLLFNGQQRYTNLPSKYFRLTQPYKYHTNIPCNYIYSYSFALKPEEHQPSGTCNFSRIDNVTLRLIREKTQCEEYNIRVYALNYNILLIKSGMGGLVFSN